MPRYQSTKTYGTDRGLSCCFRQWRASHSHCSTLHGYSLGFKFVWESETLDEKTWVFDFGGMAGIKQYLDSMFDHTVLVAEDDPALEMFKAMAQYSTMDQFNGSNESIGSLNPKPHEEGRVCALRIVPGIGCEMTARMVYEEAANQLAQLKASGGRYPVNPDVRLVSVECFEHAGNSAIYYGDDTRVSYFEVDTKDLDAEKMASSLQGIKDAIKAGKTITTSSMVQPLIQALRPDAKELGDLEPFVDQINDLHKIPPIHESPAVGVTDTGMTIRDGQSIEVIDKNDV